MGKEITIAPEKQAQFLKDFRTMYEDELFNKYGLCLATIKRIAKKLGDTEGRPRMPPRRKRYSLALPPTEQLVNKARKLLEEGVDNFPAMKALLEDFNKIGKDMTLTEEERLKRQLVLGNQLMSEYTATSQTRADVAENVVGMMRLIMQRQDIMAKDKKKEDLSEEQITQIRKEGIAEAIDGIRGRLTESELMLFDGLVKAATQRELDTQKAEAQALKGPEGTEEAEYTETPP